MPADIYARLRELAATVESKPAEMRPILLRVTTDLFVLHNVHTAQEIHLYEEMTCRLIEDADEASLIMVARKLATCLDAPAEVIRRLRAHGGPVAHELLKNNSQIAWRDLRRIASGGPCDHACAVAARSDLDRELTSILAGRPEREVARALAANADAPLAVEDMRLLVTRGREDQTLGQALLGRGGPHGGLGLEHLPLYLSANPAQRKILLHIARQAGLSQLGRPDAAPVLDEAFCTRLESAALRQKRASFALTVAEIIGCDPLCARRIVEEDSGDALTLAFIAIGLPKEIAARIFLIAFPKVALDRHLFQRDMDLYDNLQHRDAARIISAVAGDSRLNAAMIRQQARRTQPVVAAARSASEDHDAQSLRDYLSARRV